MKQRALAATFLTILLLVSAPVQADAVTDWNAVIAGSATSGRPGPVSLFDIALAHAAVHDAVQAIEGRFEPYHYSDVSKRGLGSPDAAVAAAAHRILVLLYPAQAASLDATYNAYLSANGLIDDPGLETGEAAAVALHSGQYRPVIAMAPFFGRAEAGQWRSPVPMVFLYAAITEPFALNRPSQFRPPPPPPLTSGAYLRDYEEVKSIGSSVAHPNGNTDVARFWNGNFVTQWNDALRGIAETRIQDVGDSARLFALANIAAADALIAIWDSKVHYNYWRPSTAIREGESDGNSKTVGDTGWTGLIADPPYSDYVSGANGLAGAYTGVLQQFFTTDELPFSIRSTAAGVVQTERQYSRISQAAQEVVDARVHLGIHFRFADEEGRRLGDRVAHWTFAKVLRPLH